MYSDLKNRFGEMSYERDFETIAKTLTAITSPFLPTHHWAVINNGNGYEIVLAGNDRSQRAPSAAPEGSTTDTISNAQAETLAAAFSNAGLDNSLNTLASSAIQFSVQFDNAAESQDSTAKGNRLNRRFRLCVTNVGTHNQVSEDLQQLARIRPEIDRILFAQMKPPQLEIDTKRGPVFDVTTQAAALTIQTTNRIYYVSPQARTPDTVELMVFSIRQGEGGLRFSGIVYNHPDVMDGLRRTTSPIQAIAFANGLTWSPKTGWRRTGEPAKPHHKTPAAETQSHRAAPRATAPYASLRLAFAS